jgi:predicted ribosomally synthesized peptide with nif11-like leader
MSRENVALFSKAITKNPTLNSRISEAGTDTDRWVTVAREAGFEFTPDEFAAVVSQTLGRTVTAAHAAREYLGAQYEVGTVELNDKALDTVAGGLRRTLTNT